MKKNRFILAGLLAPLYYFLALTLITHLSAIDVLGNSVILFFAVVYVMPVLPGAALFFVYKSNALKEFYRGVITSFLISFCLFSAYHFSAIDTAVYKCLSKNVEMGLGEGLVMAVFLLIYLASCAVGTLFAGIITAERQQRNNK